MDQQWADYQDAARREVERGAARDPRLFPHYSEGGTWQLLDVGARSHWDDGHYEHGNWTAGFWFGTVWLAGLGREPEVLQAVRPRLAGLLERAEDDTTHDLGFLFFPSLVLGHLLGYLGADEVEPAVAAARMTARRFNEPGRYIQAFGPVGELRSAPTSTIDTMMNLPLLWWAHAHTGESRLQEVARHHARTSARLLVRPDGSTIHLMHLDPLSGAFRAEATLQGASAASSWSRGAGWAVAGLAWSYAAVGEAEFLAVAERVSRHYESSTTPGELPGWDFSDTSAQAPRDASAAAAMALGYLVLGSVHPEPSRRAWFDASARRVLGTLGERALNRDPAVDGTLLRSPYSVPDGRGVEGASAWGDFFYGLALALAQGLVTVEQLLGRASRP
jgi:unsaturated chondroitin disaccharide hydrolase